ncbi:MAG: hypothetical protein RR998_10140 [Oscillospiraceae bacterium]
MKKLTVLCIVLALSLCGCAAKPAQGHDSIVSPEAVNPTPAVDGPAYTGNTVEGSPFVGKFQNSYVALFASKAQDVFVVYSEKEDGELEKIPLQQIPTLECREDGTFSLSVNTLDDNKYAVVNGTFTVDGITAEYTVAAGEYGNFLGADTQKFTSKLINKDELRYWGDQIGSVSGGDVFSRVSPLE